MSPPEGAADALEGHCGSDDCDWWPWAEMHACPACTLAFCESHLLAADHGCVETGS